MQKGQRIWKDCDKCRGTGSLWLRPDCDFPFTPPAPEIVPPASYTEVPCDTCDGLGIIPWGWLRAKKEDTMPGEEA